MSWSANKAFAVVEILIDDNESRKYPVIFSASMTQYEVVHDYIDGGQHRQDAYHEWKPDGEIEVEYPKDAPAWLEEYVNSEYINGDMREYLDEMLGRNVIAGEDDAPEPDG